jgi:excinuclease ABC subunit B
MFKLINSSFQPKGDQPKAIKKIVEGIQKKIKRQVLLGATGTGKTFTMANVIQKIQRSTLILSHNKTLSMQIYQEMKDFFPDNKVEYYVSYFDYYQPEAYKPSSDLYISKKVQRNINIAKMRLKTLNSLITDKCVIVVASVAAIYGCFNPTSYRKVVIYLEKGQKINLDLIKKKLHLLGYKNNKKIDSGNYQEEENKISFMLGWEENYYFQISVDENQIQKIEKKNKLLKDDIQELLKISIPPSQDYVGEEGEELDKILTKINEELSLQKLFLEKEGKFLEAERLEKRIKEDLFNLKEQGFCPGIENYSRYLDKRKQGEIPFSLLDYFSSDFLTIIDESHITVPQIKGMYNTNYRRLETLVKHGFRLPSAFDNRPLNQEEFFQKLNYAIYVSATPGSFELSEVNYQPVEQIIRPTGLLDPEIEVRSSYDQIADIIKQIKIIKGGEKILVYALTIKMAEDIVHHFLEQNIKAVFIHSRLEIFERYQVITSLRRGIYDVIVGINLLKEGIDLPEVSLVCILDADKPGFLRDTRSLIQITGRASRNKAGKVIFYANEITNSMDAAIKETNRRRQIQDDYNKQNDILPQTIKKPIKDIVLDSAIAHLVTKAQNREMKEKELLKLIKNLRSRMKKATREFKFDHAIAFRNALTDLEKIIQDESTELL